jgi:hypothetical protein
MALFSKINSTTSKVVRNMLSESGHMYGKRNFFFFGGDSHHSNLPPVLLHPHQGAILLYGLANKLDPQDSTVLGNCHSARAKEAERRGEFAESAHLYREAVAAWQGAWLPEDDPVRNTRTNIKHV